MDNSIRVSVAEGESLLDSLLRHGVSLPHECEGALVCASCCVIVRDGFESLSPAREDERDALDGITSESALRLACQATGVGGDLMIEIPRHDSPRVAGPTRLPALRIAVSERAAKHLKEQLARRAGSRAVRLAVRPAGYSGFRYVVDYADAIGFDDAVFESNGLRIVVDGESLVHLKGTTVDMQTEGLGQRLRFDNPNVSQTCGCGESFGTRRADESRGQNHRNVLRAALGEPHFAGAA